MLDMNGRDSVQGTYGATGWAACASGLAEAVERIGEVAWRSADLWVRCLKRGPEGGTDYEAGTAGMT